MAGIERFDLGQKARIDRCNDAIEQAHEPEARTHDPNHVVHFFSELDKDGVRIR